MCGCQSLVEWAGLRSRVKITGSVRGPHSKLGLEIQCRRTNAGVQISPRTLLIIYITYDIYQIYAEVEQLVARWSAVSWTAQSGVLG